MYNEMLYTGAPFTIDTEQGNQASAGNIIFNGRALGSYTTTINLDTSTTASGANGGNVDLYSNIDNHFTLSSIGLAINTTGGGSGGTNGYINLPAVSTTYSGYSNAQSYTGGIITLNGNLMTDKGAITLTGDTRLASSVTLSTWSNDTNVQTGTAGAVTISGTGVSAIAASKNLTIDTSTNTGTGYFNDGSPNPTALFTHNAGNVSIIAGNAGGAYVNNLVVNTSTGGTHNTGVTNGTIALNTVGTEGAQTYTGGATTVSGSLTTNGGNIDLAGVASLALSDPAVTFATDRTGGTGDAGSLLLGANTLNGAVALTLNTTADGGGAGTDFTLTSVGAVTPLSSLNASAANLTVSGSGVTSNGAITLGATSALNVNAAVTNAAGAGDIVLNAGTTMGLGASVSSAGAVTLNHGGDLTQTAGTVSAPTLLNLNGLGTVATSGTPLATSAATIILNKADGAGATFVHDSGTVAISGTTGGSLTLASDSDITVDTGLTLATTGAIDGSITLQADNNITVAEGASFTTQGSAVTLNSDRDANGVGNIQMNHGTSITSNGGNITLGGGANPLTTAAVGSDTNEFGTGLYGVYLNDTTLNAGAGNISIRGTGIAGTSFANGIVAVSPSGGTGGTVIQTTSGNITLNGTGGAGVDGNNGVLLTGTGTNITSATGAISITGQGAGAGAYNLGIEIRFDAAVTSTGAATISLNGTGGTGTDANSGVMLHSNAKVTSSDGAISITGQGAGTGWENYGIYMGGGEDTRAAVTSTGAATITLNGTGGAGTDYNYGVYLSDAGTIITSATGAISITGQSEGTGQANYGLFMNAGAAVTSTDTATITLNGTGGAGEYDNYGVYLSGAGTNITSSTGAISVTGQSTGTLDGNYGIFMDGGAAVASTDTATITLNGTGGAGEYDNYGVYLSGAGTNITSSNGAISITGQGTGTDTSNHGIVMDGGAAVASTDTAAITLNGTGGAGTDDNYGVYLSGANITSPTGAISITGHGAGSGMANLGIFMDGEVAVTSTDAANITLDGRGAGDAEGIYTSTFGANNTIGGATSTGNITFIADTATGADSIFLSGLDISGTGNLVLQPLNAATTIGLAGGAGTFNLDAAELSTIQSGFASITIGHENGTGQISFGDGSGTGFTFNANTTLRNPGVSSDGMTIIEPLSVDLKDLTLNTAGTVDATLGAISAAGLELLGTGGTHILTNTGNAITTLAGNTGTVNYQQADSLAIGSVGDNTPGLTAANSILVRTTGASANLTLTNGVTADGAGDALVLAAGGNFINNAGAGALAAPSGRWLVYSTDPALDTFGSLASGNLALWGKTYDTYAPVSVIEPGNRYLFSPVPNLTATVTGGAIAKTYGTDLTATPPAVAVTGLVDATDYGNVFTQDAYSGVAEATSAGFAASAPVNGGVAYTMTALGSITEPTGYGATVYNDALLTIDKAHLTVTADDKSRAYGTANPALTTSVSGFIPGENAGNAAGYAGAGSASTAAVATTTVGNVAITGSIGNLAATNYDFAAADGTLTINKAHLTVTADDKSRAYGTANSALTTSVSGFIPGENAGNAAGYAGAGSASTAAVATTTVGNVAITGSIGNLAATNYDFAAADGTLTINKAHLTVTADDKSRLYGADNPALTSTVSGFVNGENAGTATGFTGAANATTLANATTNVGTAPITAGTGNLAATNYDFTTLVDGVLTINPAALVLNSGVPPQAPEPVHIATSQIQSEFTLFNPLDQHQTLLLSPTIGGEANSYLKDVVVVGNKETRINIGGLGPILQVMNGGVRLPGNLVNENE